MQLPDKESSSLLLLLRVVKCTKECATTIPRSHTQNYYDAMSTTAMPYNLGASRFRGGQKLENGAPQGFHFCILSSEIIIASFYSFGETLGKMLSCVTGAFSQALLSDRHN